MRYQLQNLWRRLPRRLIIIMLLGLSWWIVPHFRHCPPASRTRLTELLIPCDQIVAQALFTPQDNIAQTLIDLIENEQSAIQIAVYFITHFEIAAALVKAKLVNHVAVTVVTDPSHVDDSQNSQIWFLQDNGIKVLVLDNPPPTTQSTAKRALMHNKFAIFSKNISDRQLLVTGSFNYTISAQKYNQENVVILDLPQIIAKYQQQFHWLQAHATPLDSYARKYLIGKEQAFGHFVR
ncbi:MAG TPA: phospholipase D-like domain-containing protein [Candidatus Babeliales bacterium]|nr:phospholipase D-like domain-containing protein [Candidatus Babeliales bacterium]